MPEARGTVQPVRGAAGGFQCVTASSKSSVFWVETPAHTVQIEGQDEDPTWAQVLPQLLATIR